MHEELFSTIREACPPNVWSRAVEITRSATIVREPSTAPELRFRIVARSQMVSPRVMLNPDEESWQCDCAEDDDPCAHVAAAMIALRSGKVSDSAPADARPVSPSLFEIRYRFRRESGGLALDRTLVRGTEERPITTTLLQVTNGSARLPVAATRDDYAVDHALSSNGRGILSATYLFQIGKALRGSTAVTLDGSRIELSLEDAEPFVEIRKEGSGYRVSLRTSERSGERLKGGAVLADGTLWVEQPVGLSLDEIRALSFGMMVPSSEMGEFMTRVLPSLRERIEVRTVDTELPRFVKETPYIVLSLLRDEGVLRVLPRLVYGRPPFAEVHGEQLTFIADMRGTSLVRDFPAELRATRDLQQRLSLQPGRIVDFHGEDGVAFLERTSGFELEGEGLKAFAKRGSLAPSVSLGTNGVGISSQVGGKGVSGGSADPAAVFSAWRSGSSLVPLLEGGYASVPKDWLDRHGELFERLMDEKLASGGVPSYLLPALAEHAEELSLDLPNELDTLKRALSDMSELPEARLPADLRATLRDYQRHGVAWLQLLLDNGIGAMLADDMGLGKTVQTLCAIADGTIGERTLVVAPTSVLFSWQGQIRAFRPETKVNLYYGPNRSLDGDAAITLTSYALLRLDLDSLKAVRWNTIVLDEAHTIKNPESQVARAAFALEGERRIALSGTPVENKLEDLWSQFHFLNPKLLGSRDHFARRFAQPITQGDQAAASTLHRTVRPFILRRLKRDVAPELPPRTDLLLYCELGAEERRIYDALLAATRDQVRAILREGGSVFSALELLLRLRQACCHPALLGERGAVSSKLELLLSSLEASFEGGHRAVVFSQWTSLLDLIEGGLRDRGTSFLRLDGTTRDRERVIESFQRPDGPPVLLMSLKAGGVGITVTAADHVYLCDPWWNPAAEDQAADRTHRIGQENPVFVHKLVAKDTIEERILELQAKKRELASIPLSEGAAGASLTRDDLLQLLE